MEDPTLRVKVWLTRYAIEALLQDPDYQLKGADFSVVDPDLDMKLAGYVFVGFIAHKVSYIPDRGDLEVAYRKYITQEIETLDKVHNSKRGELQKRLSDCHLLPWTPPDSEPGSDSDAPPPYTVIPF